MIEYGAKVDQPGKTGVIFNERLQEVFVHHWDCDKGVGKKFVISNAFSKTTAKKSQIGRIPAYSAYKQYFNICDRFNRNLHDGLYCHRCG
jgi:hypothetical protein